MKTFYQAGIIFLWTAFVAGNCPSESGLTPCSCSEIKNGISLQCKGPEDTDRIISIIQNIRSNQNLELVLESLTLPILPPSFKEVSSLRLYDVHIEQIQNNSSSPWSKLNDVVIEASTILDKSWQHFKGAHFLKHLTISNIEIPTIGSEFKENIPAGVSYLDVRKTRTTSIESRAMSHLKGLKYMLMVDVPLQEFPRDALPLEMPDLHTFILGNTQIKTLEPGFFEGMPKLEVLMLNGNKLSTLDSHLFAPVENHLTHLLAERNPLVCDCNLVWLTQNMQRKESIKVLATCTDTETQERNEVNTLAENKYCP